MKKLILPILVVLLAILAVYQYTRYRGFHPPAEYEYQFRTDIDVFYHDQPLVSEYYLNGRRAGALAREMWTSHRIDVLQAQNDQAESVNATEYYTQLIARADYIGARLAQSKALKDQGFNNTDILAMEVSGLSAEAYRLKNLFGNKVFEKGDKDAAVYELQRLLTEKGYKMPHDGKFYTETEDAVKDFQQKNSLFPSGKADWNTLRALLK